MARIVCSKHQHNLIRMTERDRELLLVGPGIMSYLWTEKLDGGDALTFGGQVALRRLAYAILRTIPAPKNLLRVHGAPRTTISNSCVRETAWTFGGPSAPSTARGSLTSASPPPSRNQKGTDERMT